MFKEFKLSAPGKLILCGEHAVVYGRKALASAIDLRTNLEVQQIPDLDQFILELKDIQQTICIDQKAFDSIKQLKKELNLDNLEQVLNHVSAHGGTDETKHYRAVKFMLLSVTDINWTDVHALRTTITSEIPLGSGLGSSASFATCLSALFLILSKQIALTTMDSSWSQKELDLVNAFAFQVERIFHGIPSGIDNTVATFGEYIIFEKGAITKLKSNLELPVLIVNSGMPKDTMIQVAKVRTLYGKHPQICEHVFDVIEKVVDEFVQVLAEGGSQEKLSDLVALNHGLLCSLQVSNLVLDTIVGAARASGYAGKMTGGGGGGCCLILMGDQTHDNQLVHKLDEKGFKTFSASLGSSGLRLDSLVTQ